MKEYNLRTYSPPRTVNKDSAQVIFFRTYKQKREEKEVLKFYVGKSEYSLVANDKISIRIPADSEIKACIENGSENNCILILGYKYFNTFYEVGISKSGYASIEERDIDYSEYNLNIIDHYIKKRSKR